MGNRVVYEKQDERDGPGDSVAFFQTLNVKWLTLVADRVKEIKQEPFDLRKVDERIKWNEYFRIFSDIKDKMATENRLQARNVWHPATLGYSMGPEGEVIEEPEPEPEDKSSSKVKADDHTDDDPSEVSEDEGDEDEDGGEQVNNPDESNKSGDDDNNGSNKDGSDAGGDRPKTPSHEGGSASSAASSRSGSRPGTASTKDEGAASSSSSKKKLPVNWDPAYTNPIFFGHNHIKSVEVEKKLQQEKDKIKARENRAIGKAKESRIVVIDAMQKTSTAQAQSREKKIEDIKRKYTEAKNKHEAEYTKNKKEMIPLAFNAYKFSYESIRAAADSAYDVELFDLMEIHEEKTNKDKEFLRKKREDLEAFNDAENMEIPAAEKLEVFARVEVSRSIDEVSKLTGTMNKARMEYIEIKTDYEKLIAQNAADQANLDMTNKKNQANNLVQLKQIAELKSLVSVAETAMREAKRAVEEALQTLEDAEILLDRAIRMVNQQAEILPLFQSIADMQGHHVPLPSWCNLNVFIICAILLMSSTFDQKYNFLIRLFDPHYTSTFNLTFIVNVINVVQQSLYVMKFIPYIQPKDDIVMITSRAFLSMNLNPKTDYLTEYEVKQVILTLVSHSCNLTKLLGISMLTSLEPPSITFNPAQAAYMSTYQRNRLSSLTLLSKAMIDINTCKHQLHYYRTQHRPLLANRAKQTIHDLSMGMGLDDPRRADYSKFLVKDKKAEKYRVDPLNHGHLMNITYVNHVERDEAALRIQAVFRAYQDKKVAELAARYLAFIEAKNSAIKEMKTKIIREFKKREAGKGMGKMKWDAQVRMKQAKLRTQGQSVNRSETVMIMIEENINTAKEDIELRFKELEKAEKFSGVNFDKVRIVHEPSIDPIDVSKLFHVFPPVSLVSNHLLNDKNHPTTTPTPSGAVSESKNQAEESQSSASSAEPVILTTLSKKSSLEEMDDENSQLSEGELTRRAEAARQHQEALTLSNRMREFMKGLHEVKIVKPLPGEEGAAAGNSYAVTTTVAKNGKLMLHADPPRGDSEFEWELTQTMALSEITDREHLFNRLRTIHYMLTAFKSNELLNELPSKRLLVKYIKNNTDATLKRELMKHFKFKKDPIEVIQALRLVVYSDMEDGALTNFLWHILNQAESGLYALFLLKMSKFMNNLQNVIQLKLQSNDALVEDVLIVDELSRVETIFKRYQHECQEILAVVFENKNKFKRSLLSYQEMEGKLRCIQRLKDMKQNQPVNNDIPMEIRHAWMTRMIEAFKKPETRPEDATAKYLEISNVCKEFLEIATYDANIIVNEVNFPKYLKTIPIASEEQVCGRHNKCGRGFEGGHYYTYELHNIVYHVALDYDGVFNGSDEYAAKAAGHERLGAQEYFRLHIQKLNIPLVATIDIQGYRVVAVSKLPTQNVQFNDEGEVRKIFEEHIHGVVNRGDQFVNKSKTLQGLLKQAAHMLNLTEHTCKGFKDISGSETSASSELQVFKTSDDEFYARTFWRSFPGEIPRVTKHLNSTPRDQSVFWRQLRPEFVREFVPKLSPDASSAISLETPEWKANLQNVTDATTKLIEDLVPTFVRDLLSRSYMMPLSEGLGLDLAIEMHTRGINMRHLGLMRSMLWRQLPGTVSLFHYQQMIHTSSDLRKELIHGDQVMIEGELYTVEVTKKSRITAHTIPISVVYPGESKNGLLMSSGRVPSQQNCDIIRKLLLGEMMARTIKNIIRYQMRTYNQKFHTTSRQFYCTLVVEYLNIITGSNPNADSFFQNALYDGVRERFGPFSIRASEKYTLQRDIQPVISYICNRIIAMMGIKFALTCQSEFYERPVGFLFILHDIIDVVPIVKHSVPIVSFADAQCVSIAALAVEKEKYTSEVLRDQPTVFYLFSERKGGRKAENKGTLGKDFGGTVNKGCDLEHGGPILSDKFIKSYSFRPLAKSHVDTKYHRSIVPDTLTAHFSVETFYCCTGGRDSVRVIVNSGKYSLFVGRDNCLSFTYLHGVHDVSMRIEPVVYDVWKHVVITYDGTTVRCYVDSLLLVHIEIQEILEHKQKQAQQKFEDQKQAILADEVAENELIADKTNTDGAAFFQTKEGIAYVKKESREILESAEFQAENIGDNAKDQPTAVKMRKQEANKRAKERYMVNLFAENVREMKERYRQLIYDVEDRMNREEREGKERSFSPLRIGGAIQDANTVDSSNYFYGEISCVSVFPVCLSSDRIQSHYLNAKMDRRRDAQRLHAIAASKYEVALRQVSALDTGPLSGYAKSLCSYLRMEVTSSEFKHIKLVGKAKIKLVIDQFKSKRMCDGIAEIMREIPRDVAFADLITHGFMSIKSVDKSFFSKTLTLTRKDMIYMPFEFALLDANNPPEYYETAAFIFQNVVKDHELAFIYGELDLKFLPELENAKLIIALVKQAHEDKSLKMVKVAELFKSAGHDSITVSDDDVLVLSQNLTMSEGLDFTSCTLLTNTAMSHVNRMNNIKSLNISYCIHITDKGLKAIGACCLQLEVFAMEGLTQVTDMGLKFIGTTATNIAILNVNKCPHISGDSINALARNNRKICSLQCSATLMNDDGLADFSAIPHCKALTMLDVSMCRDITDNSIISISETCSNLRTLNMKGLSRVSDQGVRRVCSNCWFLTTLNVEDVFLVTHEAFWFSATYDGRKAANLNMLLNLTYLNLSDCVHLTDRGIEGLAERCRKLEHLVLKGCDKLTDKALAYMADPTKNDDSTIAMCDSFKILSLAFTTGITGNGLLNLLSKCACLEELDLSGQGKIVTNKCLFQLTQVCKTIQRLVLYKCVLITDAALCSFADYLWLETLDISGCHRITDEGISVLSESCQGLLEFTARKCTRLTQKSPLSLVRNCTNIKLIDCTECTSIDAECRSEVQSNRANFKFLL